MCGCKKKAKTTVRRAARTAKARSPKTMASKAKKAKAMAFRAAIVTEARKAKAITEANKMIKML